MGTVSGINYSNHSNELYMTDQLTGASLTGTAEWGMLELEALTRDQYRQIQEDLTCIPNKEKAEAMGQWPKRYRLYDSKKKVKVPLGYGLSVRTDNSTEGEPRSMKFMGELRDSRQYPQKEAMRCVLRHFEEQAPIPCAMIQPCRSGKTITATAITAAKGRKTAWIVPSKEILAQTMATIQKWVHTEEDTELHVTKVHSKHIDCSGAVVVMMAPTLTSMIRRLGLKETRSLLDAESFGMFVGDEAHHFVAQGYSAIPRLFNTKYRLFMTATPARNDGLTKQLAYIMGPTAFRGTPRTDFSDVVAITYTGLKDELAPSSDDGLDYAKSVEAIHKNEDMMGIAAGLAAGAVLHGHTVLLYTLRAAGVVDKLAARVASMLEGEDIATHDDQLPPSLAGSKVPVVSGVVASTKADERELARYSRVIVCTTSMFGEGTDIPWASCIVLVGGNRSEPRSEQNLERHATMWPNKPRPILFDMTVVWLDSYSFKSAQKNRIKKLYDTRELPVRYVSTASCPFSDKPKDMYQWFSKGKRATKDEEEKTNEEVTPVVKKQRVDHSGKVFVKLPEWFLQQNT